MKTRSFVAFFLAIVMMMSLCTPALASNEKGVTFEAKLDKSTINVSSEDQTVTVTINANQKITYDGIGGKAFYDDPIKLTNITNNELTFTAAEITVDKGSGKDGIAIQTPDMENHTITNICVLHFTIPANTPAGTYELGMKQIEVTSDYGEVWETGASASVILTVKGAVVHTCSGTKQSGQSATCTVDGWNDYYKCTDSSCGKLYSDSACTNEITDLDAWKKGDGKIAASHNFGTLVDEDPGKHTATEVKDGMKAHYVCNTCGTYFDNSKNVIDKEELTIKNEHSYTTQYGYKETDGHADTCSCGAKTTVVGHTPNISAPTETEDQVCSVCGYVIAVKTGHIHQNNLTPMEKLGANCTEDGHEAYYKCSCGAYFEDASASVVIADIDAWKTGAGKIVAEGHSYTKQKKDVAYLKTEAANCTEFDVYWYACSVCDANAKDDPNATDKYYVSTDAGDHSFNEKIADENHFVAGTGADCQDVKKYYYDCDYCAVIGTTTWDSTEVGNHVKGVLDYNDDQHWYKCAKGCDVRLEEGDHSGGTAYCYKLAVCATCQKEYGALTEHVISTDWNYKDAEGHAHACTNTGCTYYEDYQLHVDDATGESCTICKYVYHTCGADTVTFVPALPGTCVKKGHPAYYKCTDAKCGKLYYDEAATSIINSLAEIESYGAHNTEIIPAVPATCTTNGATESMTCWTCGMKFMTSTVIPATGHSFGEWTTTLEPTEYAEGSKSRTCSACNEVETASIPALGHEHTVVELPAVAPTCAATGLTAGSKCATCGEILVAQETVPAIDHASVTHVGANAATSTEAGNVEHWICSECETVWLDEERTTVATKEDVVIPVIPETEPEETTQAPEETTEAPEETTAAPEETTAAPEETTAAPEETTAAPEETTAAPEETTQAPEDITVPEETTEAPVETTEAPEETTAAPEETTSPEVPSTGDSAIFFIVALIAFSAIFAFAVALGKKRTEN